MEIRLMNDAEYAASKSLWLDCFPEDEASFVDWYYARRTRPRYALGAFIKGCAKPVAMLHMVPMKMRLGGRIERVCMVAGVCTHPAYRRSGLCSRLFDAAFPIMRGEGYAASVLQPFDTAFYERFGYKTFVFRDIYTVSYERTNYIVRPTESLVPDPGRLASIYSAFTEGFSGCSVRETEYFRGFLEEYSMPGAYLAVSGSACCAGYDEGGVLGVTELFYARDPLGALALLPSGYKTVRFPMPQGMSRAVLDYFADTAGEVSLLAHVPFLMIAPISANIPLPQGHCYGFDRY